MGASRTIFLLSILYFFISSCTPYWENEIETKIDHKQITQNVNKSEDSALQNTHPKKITAAENSSELQSSALRLNDRTNELSKEIDDLLEHFNEL